MKRKPNNPPKPATKPADDPTEPKRDFPKLLITIEEAAEMFSVCERVLHQRTKLGEIPCRYIGRSLRYVPEELVAWRDGLPRKSQ